jgi:acyl-CoA thioesterase
MQALRRPTDASSSLRIFLHPTAHRPSGNDPCALAKMATLRPFAHRVCIVVVVQIASMDLLERMQSNDRFSRLCGIRTVQAGDGAATLQMEIRDEHLNFLNTVHGGALLTIADYAFAIAANSRGIPSVSLSLTMNFLRPGRAGTLTATAREVSLTSKIGTYIVEIRDQAGELIANCQGLAYRKAKEAGTKA